MTTKLKQMNRMQQDVFMLLPMGMDKPRTTQEIESILNIDVRYIRNIIEELIIGYGIPVGSLRESDKNGYFIATNRLEKIKGTMSIEHQAMAMDNRVRKVRAADVGIVHQYKEMYRNDKDTPEFDEQLDLYYYLENEQAKTEGIV